MRVHNPDNLPTAPIADLLPTQGKLKDLTDKNYSKLKNTIENRGFSVPVFVWVDENGVKHLLDGHQRQRVLTTEGWNEPIPYLTVPAENMQEAMARLLEITSQYGTITQDGIDEFIAKYELDEQEVYKATQFDNLYKFGDEEEPPEVGENPYTQKIGKPTYEIQGVKPDLTELYSTKKRDKLLEAIEKAKLPDDVSEFLRVAAYRHNIFNYAGIAEFYAQSSPEIQELMESSALVIIDFDKAVENGFVEMSEHIAKLQKDQNEE